MNNNAATYKITPSHLASWAIVYVRQSTYVQTVINTASQDLQYGLKQRAMELGWPEERILVIDEDQGCSGTSTSGRVGFRRLLAEVGTHRCKAVFCFDPSRLSRDSSDFHQFLKLCALTGALIIDSTGIYDPRDHNDKIYLGLKGTMSEVEIYIMMARLHGAKIECAKKGALRFRLPIGFIYDRKGKIIIDPDKEVQEVVRYLFRSFEELPSARAVVRKLEDEKLKFPVRYYGGVRDGDVEWGELTYGRALAILHSPAFAGAYAYGRTKFTSEMVSPDPLVTRMRSERRQMTDWPILIRDAHEGYISWDQYINNIKRLEGNQNKAEPDARGALRNGSALLQGLAVCGRCGTRMRVYYYKRQDDYVSIYLCQGRRPKTLRKTCLEVWGPTVEPPVTGRFLDAFAPAALEISVTELLREEDNTEVKGQLALRLERAEHEAGLAERRYKANPPEDVFVVETLSHEWNEKLSELRRLKGEYEEVKRAKVKSLSDAERGDILSLPLDLPAIWNSETTTQVERKQLLGFMIKDITLNKKGNTVEGYIRWHNERCDLFAVPVYRSKKLDPNLVALIRELVQTHTNGQIADHLNSLGVRGRRGLPYTASKIKTLRVRYNVPPGGLYRPGFFPGGRRGDGRYSAKVVAEFLGLSLTAVAARCRRGLLDAVRSPGGAATRGRAWWIKLTPEQVSELEKNKGAESSEGA